MELFILLIVLVILAETTFLLIKNRRPAKTGSKRKVYIDTSVLIDGRILNIAQTGFFSDDIIILKSVLRELQLLADGKDAEKRSRARAGLEIANALERIEYFNVEIVDDAAEKQLVDEQLLKCAKANRGAILTLDYNLIKVAEVEKITTLNINDLILALRNEFLPGEIIKLKITEKGANKGQGVGHLKDGTMVVVEHGATHLNEDVTAEVIRLRETSSGKILFAKIVNSASSRSASSSHYRSSSRSASSASKSTRQKQYTQPRPPRQP